jgi:mRNA-degrading endonuclease toxin of MazEF toxin-antitoxin module
VILSDQVRSLDWLAREAEFIAGLDAATVEKVLERVRTLL